MKTATSVRLTNLGPSSRASASSFAPADVTASSSTTATVTTTAATTAIHVVAVLVGSSPMVKRMGWGRPPAADLPAGRS